jgi:large subunit ribosomal protein L30
MAGSLRVTQVRSTISHIARNRATIRALGLHRIGDTAVVPDNEATRGMVRQVRFLVEVEEVPAPEAPTKRRSRATASAAGDDASEGADATAEETT